MVIDLFELGIEEVRRKYPEVYRHLLATVKPERDANHRESCRTNWWIFGEPRRELRPALMGLPRYIATVDTARHRVFQFLPSDIVCDDKVVLIAMDDASALGVLQSSIHVIWALRAGGWLGVGNDPRYSKSKVFDPFPFPSPGELLKVQIRSVAEELDAFRKERQREHPALTLTQMYNVLEKLKAREVHSSSPPGLSRGSTSSADSTHNDVDGRNKSGHDQSKIELTEEERIKEEGLILVLKELHDKLDRLVFEAYGWPAALTDEQILEKLVALNRERAAEERRGHVRWLRPDYQMPRFGKDIDKMAAREEGAQLAVELGVPAVAARKPSFPSEPTAQTAAVFAALTAAHGPTDAAAIAAGFRNSRNLEKTITALLASLSRLGHVATKDGKAFELRRAA